MATKKTPHGFSLVELAVVIVVLTILASIFYPLLTKARDSSGCSPRSNNIRQLALAMQMYVQDHQGKYPTADWAPDIENYVGSKKLYCYPREKYTESSNLISYGYSGLLLRSDGKGVNEAQVLFPTEVGAICEAAPDREWPNGGIIYGGGLQGSEYDVMPSSQIGGVLVGYCDGHSQLSQCKKVEVRDISNGVSRAFVQVLALGLLDNSSGGMHDFTPPAIMEKATISVGGDPCTRAILVAAAQAWGAKSGAAYTGKGFRGQDDTTGRTANYLWGIGDGVKPKGNAIPIARDALVLIVAKNCKIAEVTSKEYTVNAPTIRQLFATGYAEENLMVYTFDKHSGSRRFFTNTFAENGTPVSIGTKATTVKTDINMVDCVAGDPYGIGYCSAAFADPDRVRILGFKDAKGKKYHYPNDNPKYATVLPEQPSWPLMRTLYVAYGGKAWREDGSGVANVMLAPGGSGTQALHDGPLFKASYYLPE